MFGVRLDRHGFPVETQPRLYRPTESLVDRVYVAGASNGGMMALRLACERTGRLAAVAVVIANQPWPQVERCRPTVPLPLILINGTDDPLMPWGGGPVGRALR